jgi:hypothetical protein
MTEPNTGDMNLQELDDHFSEKIKSECHTHDTESNHLNADEILIELIKSIGLHKVVEEYHKVNKWYA